ncbi:MAG: hypothetical protein R8L07_06625 [Alphaproteobacteria bacterium]|jgi:hypothetical protein|nr:hypothetical protein [Alphaproteobacteria bacterium]
MPEAKEKEMETTDLKSLTLDELLGLGAGDVGYIRLVETDEGPQYELRDADGSQLATAATADAALFAAEHLDIEPVTLH